MNSSQAEGRSVTVLFSNVGGIVNEFIPKVVEDALPDSMTIKVIMPATTFEADLLELAERHDSFPAR